MPPGSKKSSASSNSSNSTGTMRNTSAVRVETAATTPTSEIMTSTPLTVASPSTRASASGAPSAKRRRVRGPTRGKRIRRIIAENEGERTPAYVTPEMRAFCGINANKVASELAWETCMHEMMVATRDEAALSGTPLSAEEISIKCLGESKTKNYIRGFGNGPKPSTYLSKSNSQSARQDQLQKLQRELDLIREDQRREREEEKTRREEEQKQREEEQRRWEETQRRRDEEWSILLKEMEVLKSFMSQMQNGGQGNMGAG